MLGGGCDFFIQSELKSPKGNDSFMFPRGDNMAVVNVASGQHADFQTPFNGAPALENRSCVICMYLSLGFLFAGWGSTRLS